MDQLLGVIVTHLDSDHWYPGWMDMLPAGVRVLVHANHIEHGRRTGLLNDRAESISGTGRLAVGLIAAALLAAHDELGCAAFRFEFDTPAGAATLGFATDVGRADQPLLDHLRDVDVLAIESNYCPRLQARSGRPWFLRQRITSGAGHLSNQQCAAAVRTIGPRSHVVLLHLSRHCNHPDLAHAEHLGADYSLTVSAHNRATGWIPIAPGGPARRRAPPTIHAPLFAELLFDAPAGMAD